MLTNTNLRKYERATFLCPVAIAVGQGETLQATSVDISLGGAGLISPKLVPMGQRVTLSFQLRNSAQVAIVETVRGHVVFVHSDVDGNRLGVEFEEPLDRSRNPLLTKKVENL